MFREYADTIVLDCETPATTLKCLSIAFGCRVKKLRKILRSINMEEICESLEISCEDHLYNYVCEYLGDHKPISSVYWHHTTRTISSSDFKDGILPLRMVIDNIWDMLESILEETEHIDNLKSIRANGVNDERYNLKISNEVSHGPYGILVKDVAFNATRLGQHDYLGVPEIIEDICRGYKKDFDVSIQDIITDNLQPCIVKFKKIGMIDNHFLKPALYYAYTCVNRLKVSGASVCSEDYYGEIVQPECIAKVEFVSLKEL